MLSSLQVSIMTSRIFEGSTLASDYARYRPSVPAVVTESVIKHIREATGPKLGLVVDVGCGSGQFTQSLAQYFDRALGFDVSEAQIEEAKKHNKFSHVEYRHES
nr:putative methyltransferase DDB_G0268948 isoform X3 [Lytechinus pictus]